jgi:putative hydrolase
VNVFRSLGAVAGAEGDGPIDWDAASEAAKAATAPGSVEMTAEEQDAYADDVRDARDRVRSVTDLAFDLPTTVEIQNRHHWMETNVETFGRVMAPLEDQEVMLPGVSRVVNTGTMGVMLAFLGRNVLGQYDPLLLAEGDDHALYFVHPNIEKVADTLDVEYPRFRRWIAIHEVTHAAEFGAAPWLSDHLETRMESGIEQLTDGGGLAALGALDSGPMEELNAAMTAVEGYAELVMDRAFEGEFADVRRKVDERRGGGGPLTQVLRRLLGMGLKRRQYERGRAFFETVADERGLTAAGAVWDDADSLPTGEEFDHPARWIDRVDP